MSDLWHTEVLRKTGFGRISASHQNLTKPYTVCGAKFILNKAPSQALKYKPFIYYLIQCIDIYEGLQYIVSKLYNLNGFKW